MPVSKAALLISALVPVSSAWEHVEAVSETMSTSVSDNYTTYRLYVELSDSSASAYALFGSKSGHLWIPPAYQDKTFGQNMGGVDPNVIKVSAAKNAQWDSWLTVGIVDGDAAGLLGAVGLGSAFKAWSETQGIDSTDGSVFWMNPTKSTATKKNGKVCVAQLTFAKTYKGCAAKMGVTGKDTSGNIWRDDGVQWVINGGSKCPEWTGPPPPTPHPNPTTPPVGSAASSVLLSPLALLGTILLASSIF